LELPRALARGLMNTPKKTALATLITKDGAKAPKFCFNLVEADQKVVFYRTITANSAACPVYFTGNFLELFY